MSSCANADVIVIGIAGASGSGKTFFATKLAHQLTQAYGRDRIAVIQEDFYYKDQRHIPLSERTRTNYDHPDALDHELMSQQLAALKAAKTLPLKPTRVIIVEGILLFADAHLREQLDIRLFIDAPLDLCILRRARRDVKERGRTLDSVMRQYMATVRPMYLAFIEPSKQWAHLLVPGAGDIAVAMDVVKAKLDQVLSSGSSRMPETVTAKL